MSRWPTALLLMFGMLTTGVSVRSSLAATQPPLPPSSATTPEEVGILVAVAIGGRCRFSVDDEPITTTETLRLPLPTGVHVVKCGSRTRNVTIKDGEISMALFKLR
ncbi:hypothetical protein [Polyangium sp. 6x1]|uniref:hypothetical protein n=1 Tax=Polyangium sp. 6x1 TaxID=3042689 RepID=UPI00248251FE|nr:hypothetical protein [Polyangium sp. 6x1]